MAAVEVSFGHSNSDTTNSNQNTGTITLEFTVDGSGNVTLNASCVNSGPAANVNEFDGPCGTISDASMWGQNFSIVLSSVSGSLRVSGLTTGLSVQGQNSHLVDAVAEQITATVNGLGTKFRLQDLGYASATTSAGTQMNVSGTAYDLSGSGGTVDVSAQEITGTFTIDSATDLAAQGFVLSGLSFDVVAEPTPPLVANDAVVTFANSGTGYGPTTPYIGPSASAATITLGFSINSAGIISLDASTSSTSGGIFSNMVAEWDKTNVGSVADPLLLGKSFTLVGSQSGGANLTISELDGGGIGIQGENSNRVDGLNYGTGDVNSTPETLTWTLNAPAGLELVIKSWSFIQGTGGDIRVSDGTTNSDFPNMTSATGTLTLPSLPLANGESLSFKEIPGIGATTGAGIAGFTFAVTAPAAAEGFDNGAGNNLWTNATNWNPDGVPVAPSDAIIDGYNVILNSAASASPDELLITNGSLTLTGSGALSMRSMTIGRDLTKTARLVIDGSGVSFGYNGSSAADEFAVGSAATVETKPDSSGSEPLELGAAKLVLDAGSEWILDGTNASGFSYNLGARFVMANFGSFEGNTAGFRTRNFNLPANRRLELVAASTSIYYEVKAQTTAAGPNIILINVDDMAGGQHFGFEGRNCITPTLDSLATTGLRFTSGFAASTVCGPSRYSLMTSRWASRNTSAQFSARYPVGTLGRFGVSDTELEPDGQNLGAWLQQAGYRTGMVGKGHLTDDDLNSSSNWAAKGLMTYPQNADPATDAATNAKMKHNHRVLCQRMQAFGFDYVASYYKANLKELLNDALNVHNQEWITKGALDFIEENHNERFFLYMAPTINHGPVNNSLTKTLLADNRYTSAGYLPNEDYSFMPTRATIVNQVNNAGKELISARETWLDYSIQAILNKLTQHGIRNDTLIIFTSDHGEKDLNSTRSGQGPVIWGKSSLYDLGMRVPLVMNWPNGITSQGRTYDEIVSHVDIGPTLLALNGASALPTRPVDGVSLVPVFDGSSAAVRQDLFAEIGYARAVRTKDRKYIAVRYTPTIYDQIASGFRWQEYSASGTTSGTVPRPYYLNNSGLGGGVGSSNPTYFDDDQLYNLSTDPNEDSNLFGQEPATAYDLKKRLANYIGGIPDRPFRQFSDSSKEFSPAPSASPTAPGSVQMTFQGLNQVILNWSDSADSELGYIVRKTVNGGTPVMVGEYPPGTTTATVNLDNGVSDILLQVASYNTQGDTAVIQDLLSPEPWRFRTFGGADPSLTQPASQWSSDADGDGVTMLMEYAAGTDPLSASSVAKPAMQMTTDTGNRFLEYVLPRSSRRGVQFRGAVSSDLTTWQSGSPHCTIVEEGADQMIFRSATPVGGNPRQFIRAEMINPPAP